MGYYIDHEFMDHEEWLAAYATPLSSAPAQHIWEDKVALCLVDNGLFTVLGVMFSPAELERSRFGPRFRRWFTAPLDVVRKEVPGLKVE